MAAKEFEERGAVVSPCGLYRYRLERTWRASGPWLVWVMLNPSTADAKDDDPTIRRVRAFTKREGYGGFYVVNIWALRATDPKDLHARRAAYEPENMEYIERAVRGADVVVAWGGRAVFGPALQRVRDNVAYARRVRCLGLTKGKRAAGGVRVDRQPRHPLMLRADTPFEAWVA